MLVILSLAKVMDISPFEPRLSKHEPFTLRQAQGERFLISICYAKLSNRVVENYQSLNRQDDRVGLSYEELLALVPFERFEHLGKRLVFGVIKVTSLAAPILEWLDNESAFLDMLEDRNKTSHIYDENESRQIFKRISAKYLNSMEKVLSKLQCITSGQKSLF